MIKAVVSSFRVLSDHSIGKRNSLWSHIVTLTNEPPDSDENCETPCDQAGVVHGLSISGYSIRKAENNDEGDDVDAAQDIDDIADRILHVKVSGSN